MTTFVSQGSAATCLNPNSNTRVCCDLL